MAGGDLLYIFAFIILPTAVLVSCIWALIMLRNGRLLSQRPAPPRNELDDSLDDEIALERDQIEETGEHVVIEPGQPLEPAVVVPATPTPDPEVRPAPTAAPVVAEASNEPVVEQTQELSAVPVEAATDDVPDDVTAKPVPPPAVAANADVLMVPLEEPKPPFINGRTEPASADALDQDPEDEEPVAAAAPEPKRPARRPVRLHPGEPDPARSRPRIGQRKTTRRDGR